MQPDKRTDNTARNAVAEALKDRTSVHIGGSRGVKDVAFKRVRNAFRRLFTSFGAETPNQHEMKLDADEFSVKRALGKSFFTKKRTRARDARINSLSNAERKLARAKGWI